MRTCHACQDELDPAAISDGKCPSCGALLRKLSQRTIDTTKLRDASGKSPETVLVDDFLSNQESDQHKKELTDTDQSGATIESNDLEMVFDDNVPALDDDATPL